MQEWRRKNQKAKRIKRQMEVKLKQAREKKF